MSKKFPAILICIVALLSTLLFPAVHTTKSEPASGEWTYQVDLLLTTKEANGNTFKYGEETGTWSGTFTGTSFDFFELVAHPSGFVTCQGLIDFTGTVNGVSGTMIIKFIGKKTGDPLLWSGTWVIISGTGGLANLRGRGTWWGPSLDLDYSGNIHFDPS